MIQIELPYETETDSQSQQANGKGREGDKAGGWNYTQNTVRGNTLCRTVEHRVLYRHSVMTYAGKGSETVGLRRYAGPAAHSEPNAALQINPALRKGLSETGRAPAATSLLSVPVIKLLLHPLIFQTLHI